MSKILRGISESVEQNDDMFSAVLEYLGQTQPDLFSRYGDEKVANTVQTVVATANDYLGGPKKFAQQVISNLQSPSEVDEGEVVQFPKKHKGDLEGVDSCPKCGGDLLSGKYMGHAVKVCNPCKQVYLPPNSGIDQRGNKIDEEDMAEADAKPIDMKRWLRDFERREDKNFHTENVIAIAKLVGSPEDIKMANDIKKEHMKQGGLSHELYTFRQMLYKKLWPLVQQKIEDSQSQGVAEGSKVKTAKGYGDVVQGTDVKTIAKADLGKNKLNLPQGYGDVVQPQKLKTIAKAKGVAEAGYPDVDHMPGLVNKYNRTPAKPTSNNKFYTDKKQWLRDVDDINHSKYDDNSEYIGQTGRSSVEINGVPWAVWSDAKQKGYIAMGAMSEEKQRLDPKCWSGYKKQGTKMKGGTRVNNCVKIEETEKEADYGDDYQSMVGRVGQKAKEQEKKKPVDIAALARRLNKPEPKKVDEFVSGTVMARPRHVPSQVELQKRKSDIMKGIDENLGTPYPSTYEKENNPFKHKGAHRTTTLTSESKKK